MVFHRFLTGSAYHLFFENDIIQVMIWNPFASKPKSFLGVDIGTFSIKIVELSKQGNRKKLDNYGEIQAGSLYEKSFRTFEKSTLTVSSADVVRAIKAVLAESKMKSQRACFSIPDFSTFFTNFSLPAMTEEEIPQAVQYEARQHIPLPMSEVTLDWQIVGREGKNKKDVPFKVLLVAVPNEVIKQYQEIAVNAGLELLTLEAEVFSLARALSDSEEGVVALVDIGARSTTISLIEQGNLKISHSFDTSGNDFTNVIAKGLNLDYRQAEDLKMSQGLKAEPNGARDSLMPLVDLIANEFQKIFKNFYYTENKEVKKVVMAGGSALMPGLADYLSENLKKPVEIINPFSVLYYPPILEETLKEMGPSYAIAVGTALRGFQL